MCGGCSTWIIHRLERSLLISISTWILLLTVTGFRAMWRGDHDIEFSAMQHWVWAMLLLLLLHSLFSRVWLCVTPETAAHQAPPSLGFSRQEHWSGLPFPSPIMKVKSESEVALSCPTLSDPTDCSPPGSSVQGIFQREYWSGLPLPSPGYGLYSSTNYDDSFVLGKLWCLLLW